MDRICCPIACACDGVHLSVGPIGVSWLNSAPREGVVLGDASTFGTIVHGAERISAFKDHSWKRYMAFSGCAYVWSVDRCRHQSAECSTLRRHRLRVPLFGAIVSVNVTRCVCVRVRVWVR